MGALRRVLRRKRWVYALLAADEVLCGLAVVEAGWFAAAFTWALDRRSGRMLAERSASGLPGLMARVAERPGGGARFRGPGLAAALVPARDGGLLVHVDAGRGLRVQARLEPAGAPPPFTLVAPVPGGGVRSTEKCGALGLSGALVAGGARFALDGGSAGLDFTAGLLARETTWRWAFGTGRDRTGRPLAVNLCEGNGLDPADPGENALLHAGGPSRLPPVAFAFDRDRPLAPWRVEGGGVRLDFTPAGLHREVKDLGVLASRFVQVAGTFDGSLPAPGGGTLEVRALPGVVEDHHARW